MLLAEVLIRKRNIENKVADLESHLLNLARDDRQDSSGVVDELVTKIYELLDEHQQLVFTVDKANNSIKVRIGGASPSLAAAIRLRGTIKRKMDVLSCLIKACSLNKNSTFSVSNLLDDKDKLLAEYNILTAAVQSKDWTVELDS